MDFTVRSRDYELMDDPEMEFDVLKRAYRDINLCNRMLGGHAITTRAVWEIIKKHQKKSYTILDMGCGDGTMLIKVSQFLSSKGVSHEMIGVDQREDVLAIARAKSKAFPKIQYHKLDILKADVNLSSDIVINTLTMHHFDEERIDAFLSKFVQLAKIAVVINDLQRSKAAYFLFKVFGFFFIKTRVAKYDGLVSISKGFKRHELISLAKKIPNVTHRIVWKWAFRYVWVMEFNRLRN